MSTTWQQSFTQQQQPLPSPLASTPGSYSATRAGVIRFLLDHLDDTNYHVCGDCWQRLGLLVDAPGATFGRLASWVWVAACCVELEPIPFDDRYDTIADDCSEKARQILGLSEGAWDAIQRLPLDKTRRNLRALLDLETHPKYEGQSK